MQMQDGFLGDGGVLDAFYFTHRCLPPQTSLPKSKVSLYVDGWKPVAFASIQFFCSLKSILTFHPQYMMLSNSIQTNIKTASIHLTWRLQSKSLGVQQRKAGTAEDGDSCKNESCDGAGFHQPPLEWRSANYGRRRRIAVLVQNQHSEVSASVGTSERPP